MFLENMKNRWVMAGLPTNFETEKTMTEQAAAFYEERAKGGVGAIVVRIEDIANFDVESMRDFVEKLHTYDCKVWIACAIENDIITIMNFVKKCGADGVQLDISQIDDAILECIKNNKQSAVLLHIEKSTNQKFYKKIENIVDGVVIKGDIKDCEKVKSGTTLSVIWECDVITKQEATAAFKKKLCDGIASQKMFLISPDFVHRWEEEKPYAACCQCGVCTEAMANKTLIHCPYCPETGREYLENQRRKIATRKEVIVTQGGAVGMYAAKKAAERGFLTTLFCREMDKNSLSEYERYLMGALQELGVKIETKQQVDAAYLLEKKPYLTVFVHTNLYVAPNIPNLQNVSYTMANMVLQYAKKDMKQFAKCHILLLGGNQQAVDTAMHLRKYTNGEIYMVEQKQMEETDIKNPHVLEELDQQNIHVIYGANIEEVQADKVSLQIGEQRYNWLLNKKIDVPDEAVKIVVAGNKEEIDDGDAIMALMDERLSYAVVGQNDGITDGLEEVFELFSRFYLA